MRHLATLAATAVASAAVVLLAACGAPADHVQIDARTAPPPAGAHTVVYTLGGSTNSADITIQTPGGSSQQQGVDVPLRRSDGSPGLSFTMSTGEFMYISAQNHIAVGTISCAIAVDGVVAVTNSASGAYAIVTCEGTV